MKNYSIKLFSLFILITVTGSVVASQINNKRIGDPIDDLTDQPPGKKSYQSRSDSRMLITSLLSSISSNSVSPNPLANISAKKKFQCAWAGCTSSFANSGHLTNHIRTHTGERPYQCTWAGCTSSFAQSGHLTTHMRRHTGERPHQCTWAGCASAFIESGDLTNHMRTHTGERPHKCTWAGCTSSFAKSDNLARHMRTHTGERPHQCIRKKSNSTVENEEDKNVSNEDQQTITTFRGE